MTVLTLLHVIGGSLALVSGAASLVLRKGGRWHVRSGTVFFASMLTLGSTGAAIAATGPERGTMVIGILTCYLVLTAWLAGRRRDGSTGAAEWLAFVLGVGCATAMWSFGFLAANSPSGALDSLPAGVHFPFAAIVTLGVICDLNYILRPTAGRHRILRHVWRICTALLIAAFSFFLGQQDTFPDSVQGHPLFYVPPLTFLVAMVFWIFRVRFSKAFDRFGPRRAAPVPTVAQSVS